MAWNRQADPRERCDTRFSPPYSDPRNRSTGRRFDTLPVNTSAELRPGPDCAPTGVRITLLSVIVWIALVVWLGLVIWSLSVVRAAAGMDAPAPAPARIPTGSVPFAGRRRAVAIGQAIALAAVLGVAAYLSDESQWTPLPLLGLLALLVLGSDILVLDAKRFRIGGAFTRPVLAMALLRAPPPPLLGPAAAPGVAPRPRGRRAELPHNNLPHS